MRSVYIFTLAKAVPFGDLFLPILRHNGSVVPQHSYKKVLGTLLQAKKHEIPYIINKKEYYS